MADVTTPSAATAVHLYLDIETIPTQDPTLIAEIQAKHQVPDLDLSAIVADGRLTDLDKINADILKKQDKAIADHEAAVLKAADAADAEYRKTSLDGTTGHIACIYHAFGDGPIAGTSNEPLKHFSLGTMTMVAPGDPLGRKARDKVQMQPAHSLVINNERAMLERFFTAVDGMVKLLSNERWAAIEASGKGLYGGMYTHMATKHTIPPVVVAHHSAFDLRYIWQRAIILGVEVPAWWPHDAKAWDVTKVQDTMTMWAGVGQRIGLDRLCRALGIEGNGDIDGSKVWDYVRAGKIADVAQYCGDDVERLRGVHRRLKGWPDLPTAEERYEDEARAEMAALDDGIYESREDA